MDRSCFRGAFEGVRVLLTGHTGFKGSWMALWLKELGAEVYGYGLTPGPESNFHLCRLGEKPGIHGNLAGDMRDFQALNETLKQAKPELVLHLAAQPIVALSYQEPKLTFDVNVSGTVNVLEAVRHSRATKAVVVITTDKVYENQEWIWGYRENDILGGYDPYAASKAMAEIAVRSYRQSWERMSPARRQVSLASARAGNVIGGGDFGAFRLLPDCMKSFLRGEPMTLRNPLSARPWQFVLEAVGGYLSLAAALLGRYDRPGSGYADSWNFGPLERVAVTCEDVVNHAAKAWGMKTGWRLAQGAKAFHETNILRLNWEKAANLLGWSPVYTWQESVEETVAWFKAYEAQLDRKGAGSVDMYATCLKQISRYVSKAKRAGLWWASPGA